ncbi:hypothetical protein GO495_06755 [Chitinophaga oryziterrae]|uniref:Uncharacterized protein n=1 Tax=Chitinophaga oryziterrae TaxID=1031224 RepID=A0A6N8J4U7_9BACT|nr:hypothetical protein [Chitinophaga oryziterrae]MVT40275.1 hypothetical protein [Chitinophaga oryziterrae]
MGNPNVYVFEWLDNLINFELNPAFSYPSPMPGATVGAMIEKVKREMQLLQNEIRQQYFSEKGEGSSEMLIVKNYDAITVMMNKTYQHMHHENIEKANIIQVLQTVMTGLQELRNFFKTNYAKYLSTEQALPLVDLMKVRHEIIEKRQSILDKLHATGNGDEVSSIVMDALDDFTLRISAGDAISERETIYHQSIIKDIENYKGQETALSNCPSLHELLVYWNLNSRACIRYFSLGMEAIMKSSESVDDQLDFMRLQLKNIHTLPMMPDFIYDPTYPSMKAYFGDYIVREIEYLEKKKIGFQPNEAYNAEKNKTAPYKITCALSADQIALFLRAAKDRNLIISRSVTAVFNNMVPFISTQKETDLSPDSVRIKSYQGEQRDKDILIEALEKIIETVKQY